MHFGNEKGLHRDFNILTWIVNLRKHAVFFKSVKPCLSSWSILVKNTLRNAGDEETTNVENVKNLMWDKINMFFKSTSCHS